MKTLKYLSFILFTFLLVFTSCKKEDDVSTIASITSKTITYEMYWSKPADTTFPSKVSYTNHTGNFSVDTVTKTSWTKTVVIENEQEVPLVLNGVIHMQQEGSGTFRIYVDNVLKAEQELQSSIGKSLAFMVMYNLKP